MYLYFRNQWRRITKENQAELQGLGRSRRKLTQIQRPEEPKNDTPTGQRNRRRRRSLATSTTTPAKTFDNNLHFNNCITTQQGGSIYIDVCVYIICIITYIYIFH